MAFLFYAKSISEVNDVHKKGHPKVPCRKGWDTFRLTHCLFALYVELVHGVIFTRRFKCTFTREVLFVCIT